MKRLLLILLIGLIGLTAFGCGLLVFGAYRMGWENDMVRGLAGIAPVPAASFAGKPISLRDYFHDVDSIRTYLASADAKSQGLARAMTSDDKRQVLERLLEEAAINELAFSRRVTVSDDEVNQAIQQQFNTTGKSDAQLTQFVHDTFGWSMDDLKMHLVRPILLERKIAASYAADHNNDLNALQQYLDERLKKKDVVRYVKF
jgi:hypothetical protein